MKGNNRKNKWKNIRASLDLKVWGTFYSAVWKGDDAK